MYKERERVCVCVCPTAVEGKLHLGVPKEVWKDQDVYIKKEHSGGGKWFIRLIMFYCSFVFLVYQRKFDRTELPWPS